MSFTPCTGGLRLWTPVPRKPEGPEVTHLRNGTCRGAARSLITIGSCPFDHGFRFDGTMLMLYVNYAWWLVTPLTHYSFWPRLGNNPAVPRLVFVSHRTQTNLRKMIEEVEEKIILAEAGLSVRDRPTSGSKSKSQIPWRSASRALLFLGQVEVVDLFLGWMVFHGSSRVASWSKKWAFAAVARSSLFPRGT